MKKTIKRAKVTVQNKQQTIKLVKDVVKAQLRTVSGGRMTANTCKHN